MMRLVNATLHEYLDALAGWLADPGATTTAGSGPSRKADGKS